MKTLPIVDFCGVDASRLIIGSNPFCGKSHFSFSLNDEMKDYFTDENIISSLFRCEEEGMTVMQMRGDPAFLRIIREYWRQGGKMKWFTQPDPSMKPYDESIKRLSDAGAAAIYLHGTVTDALSDEGKEDELTRLLSVIKDTGLPVGLGTHMPELIYKAEKDKWPTDFYMASVFNLSRNDRKDEEPMPSDNGEPFYADDRMKMFSAVRQTEKPCLVLKILGAGRLCRTPSDTEKAFKQAFTAIKKNDVVIVGIYPKNRNQISEDAEYVRKYSALSL